MPSPRRTPGSMSDLIYLAVIVGFFALAFRAPAGLRAHHRPRHHRRRHPGAARGRARGGVLVSFDNIVGLVLAVAILGYLVVALVFPERF